MSWLEDHYQPRTDTLYADFTTRSHLLPAERPWLFRMGDIVRLESGELVQILDGFLHVRRALGRNEPTHVPAGSTMVIVAAAYYQDSSL